MKVLKTSLTLLLGLLLMLPAYTGALAGETQQQLTSESVIETIKKRGKLMVGMSTFVPWAMRNKQGELIGFEIDVAKKVAEDMGVDIEFVPHTMVRYYSRTDCWKIRCDHWWNECHSSA